MEEYIVRVYSDKTEWFNKANQLHRLDGPAVEVSDGYKAWCQNGQLHRLGGPARDRDLALFAPFPHDHDVSIAQIHIFDFESTIFTSADPSIKKQKQISGRALSCLLSTAQRLTVISAIYTRRKACSE